MKKLIELGVAIDTAICAADEYDGGYNFERERKIRDALMALPTVDAVPVNWIMAQVKERSERGTAFDISVASILRTMVKEWKDEQTD